LTGRIYYYRDSVCVCGRHAANASKKASCLGRANPNGAGFTRHTTVGDVDVTTASGESSAGAAANSDIVTSGVIEECLIANRCVIERSSVVKERVYSESRVPRAGIVKSLIADGRVNVTCRIIVERVDTNRCVPSARVVEECLITDGCVVASGRIEIERPIAVGGVDVAVNVTEERLITDARIRAASGITRQRGITAGSIRASRRIAQEREITGRRVGGPAAVLPERLNAGSSVDIPLVL